MKASFIAGAAFAAFLLASNTFADEALKSGPQVGQRNNRGAFYPNLVTGPGAGERRCPV